jgi:hypothetical protein
MSHDHDHNAPAAMVDEISDFEALEIAVREICIEKGLVLRRRSPQIHRVRRAHRPHAGGTHGCQGLAGPEYKKLVMTDAIAASKAVGVDYLNPTGFGTPSDYTDLRVLEDTPTVHHVVVCTLCSCYPRPILGFQPEWYRTPNYRRRLVRWPRQVLAEFGLTLPAEVDVRVEDSNQKCRFIVMPVRPAGTKAGRKIS